MTDWSRDGAYLIFASRGKETGWDIYALPMTGDHKPIPLGKTKFGEGRPVSRTAVSSPTGRTSRADEVYVQEFPEAKSKYQVSPDGGRDPFWRADGRELYYRAPNRKIMAVPIESRHLHDRDAPGPLRGALRVLRARGCTGPHPTASASWSWRPSGRDSIQPATVVLNWTSGIQQGGSSSVP